MVPPVLTDGYSLLGPLLVPGVLTALVPTPSFASPHDEAHVAVSEAPQSYAISQQCVPSEHSVATVISHAYSRQAGINSVH